MNAQAVLVRAVQHMLARYKLVLAGEGPEMETVKALVARLGVEQRVRLLETACNVESLLKPTDVHVLRDIVGKSMTRRRVTLPDREFPT